LAKERQIESVNGVQALSFARLVEIDCSTWDTARVLQAAQLSAAGRKSLNFIRRML
jgi:hypothetical protein